MVPLVGYLDRVSGRPGEQIGVKVSSQLGVPYAADLVRIIHADPNPSGPGMKLEDVLCGFAGQYPSRARSWPTPQSPAWVASLRQPGRNISSRPG